MKSTERLRTFANDSSTCRWVGLLGLMGERPPFNRCGVCDTCANAQKHAGDMERDFGPEARVMLTVVQGSAVWTQMQQALGFTSPEGSRVAPSSIEGLRAALRPRRSVPVLREFLPLLVQAGLVQRSTKTGSYGAYDTYHLTPRGHGQLQAFAQMPPPPLMLAVPESVRKAEDVDKAKATKTRVEVNKLREKLLAAGYDVAAVPEAELEPGAERTPVTTALLQWARTLDDWRARGQDQRADAHEALYKSLVQWRQAEAARLRMAPASVLADHLAFKIALVKPAEPESVSPRQPRAQTISSRCALPLTAACGLTHASCMA